MLNELISNALKHAFPGDRAGDVVVTIGRAEDGSGLIQVADDGVGLPERLPTGPSDSLGIRLVESLAQQVAGVLSLVRQERGTEARLVLPLANQKPRQSPEDGRESLEPG